MRQAETDFAIVVHLDPRLRAGRRCLFARGRKLQGCLQERPGQPDRTPDLDEVRKIRCAAQIPQKGRLPATPPFILNVRDVSGTDYDQHS